MTTASVALDDALMADIRREMKQVESLTPVLDRIMANAKRRDYEESADYAVNETMAWLDGIPSGTQPEPEDIWRYCLGKFQYHQSLPVVTKPDHPHVEIDGIRHYFRFDEDATYWAKRPAPTCPMCAEEFQFFAKLRMLFDDNGKAQSVTCPLCLAVIEVRR